MPSNRNLSNALRGRSSGTHHNNLESVSSFGLEDSNASLALDLASSAVPSNLLAEGVRQQGDCAVPSSDASVVSIAEASVVSSTPAIEPYHANIDHNNAPSNPQSGQGGQRAQHQAASAASSAVPSGVLGGLGGVDGHVLPGDDPLARAIDRVVSASTIPASSRSLSASGSASSRKSTLGPGSFRSSARSVQSAQSAAAEKRLSNAKSGGHLEDRRRRRRMSGSHAGAASRPRSSSSHHHRRRSSDHSCASSMDGSTASIHVDGVGDLVAPLSSSAIERGGCMFDARYDLDLSRRESLRVLGIAGGTIGRDWRTGTWTPADSDESSVVSDSVRRVAGPPLGQTAQPDQPQPQPQKRPPPPQQQPRMVSGRFQLGRSGSASGRGGGMSTRKIPSGGSARSQASQSSRSLRGGSGRSDSGGEQKPRSSSFDDRRRPPMPPTGGPPQGRAGVRRPRSNSMNRAASVGPPEGRQNSGRGPPGQPSGGNQSRLGPSSSQQFENDRGSWSSRRAPSPLTEPPTDQGGGLGAGGRGLGLACHQRSSDRTDRTASQLSGMHDSGLTRLGALDEEEGGGRTVSPLEPDDVPRPQEKASRRKSSSKKEKKTSGRGGGSPSIWDPWCPFTGCDRRRRLFLVAALAIVGIVAIAVGASFAAKGGDGDGDGGSAASIGPQRAPNETNPPEEEGSATTQSANSGGTAAADRDGRPVPPPASRPITPPPTPAPIVPPWWESDDPLLQYISSVAPLDSTGASLYLLYTPQGKAMEWLRADFEWLGLDLVRDRGEMNGAKAKQRFALAVLYYGLKGEAWAGGGAERKLTESYKRRSRRSEDYSSSSSSSSSDDVSREEQRGLRSAQENVAETDGWPAADEISVELGVFQPRSSIGVGAEQNDWLGSSDECTWRFITCQQKGGRSVVTELNLEEVGIPTGSELPAEVGMLPELRSLILSTNEVEGNIPDVFVQLPKLRILHLNDCLFDGTIPTSIGTLTKLEELKLNFNFDLHGTIPDMFGGMGSLRLLDLQDNYLGGSLPKSFGSLSNLEKLMVSSNELTGGLDFGLGQLTKLDTLWAFKNVLSGTIPRVVGTLSRITDISLDENFLGGTLPNQIGLLPNLEDLWLQKNDLRGTLPQTLGQLGKLKKLYVDENEFSGTVPNTIGGLDLCRQLYLNNNDFTGTVPKSIGAMGSLEKLKLEGNRLEGTMPEKICLLKLELLSSDCGGLNPEVDCWCCTKCF